MVRPGDKQIAELGGVHKFMCWDRPILTDSGGYQAWSMADINSIDEDGVTFKSIVDGSSIRMTPELSIWIQYHLDAEISSSFDACPSTVYPHTQYSARLPHSLLSSAAATTAPLP